ncbi:MAG TPA: ribosome-associated translation inhibitor RaiA [Solirubrobacteraceae bacterium]|nr:ribosome-associated translation inhibitor RaiA [Solirubrobacteraceae bacterium]
MRISVKGRNVSVSEELREHVARRFNKVARQVSELAELEVEVFEERNPAIADSQVAEATLHLKGTTLRARDASPDIVHSINLVSDELAKQVKRHRDKRRKRRQARASAVQETAGAEVPVLDDDSDLGEPVVEGVLLEPAPERPADAA